MPVARTVLNRTRHRFFREIDCRYDRPQAAVSCIKIVAG
jgi:hypothetical protein